MRWPRHPGQRPCPPDQVLEEVPGPPPARRGPWLEARLVADRIPREGADEIVPGKGLRGRGCGRSRNGESPWPAWSPRLAAMRAARTARYMPYKRYKNWARSSRFPPVPAVGGRGPRSASRPATSLAAQVGVWLPPRHAARDTMSPWRAPTPGSPT